MSPTKRYETMKIELSNYDWQDAIDAVKWPLQMDTMPLIDLRFSDDGLYLQHLTSTDKYAGNAIDLVQSIKDKLDTFEQGTYNHEYASTRLNRLFKAYL